MHTTVPSHQLGTNMKGLKQFMFSLLVCCGTSAFAQPGVYMMNYGNMDNWVDRQVTESGLIGGEMKHVWAIGPTMTIEGDEAYFNKGGSPWASSNVMAKVVGITKTNTSVFPEKRGNGYCARLETRMEKVKVLGLINMEVLAAGSIFLGNVHEPIKGTKNPQKMLNSGIPFTQRPKALRFDYKVQMSTRKNRIKSTGFGSKDEIEGRDLHEVNLFLQKRWEDEEGNIYAKRVGTMVVRFDKDCDWQNDATFTILYGDITKDPSYDESMMGLNSIRYGVNSKGESVPIQEVGWAEANETPTHMQMQFTSSHGGAYIGSPGNILWIDNVKLVY